MTNICEAITWTLQLKKKRLCSRPTIERKKIHPINLFIKKTTMNRDFDVFLYFVHNFYSIFSKTFFVLYMIILIILYKHFSYPNCTNFINHFLLSFLLPFLIFIWLFHYLATMFFTSFIFPDNIKFLFQSIFAILGPSSHLPNLIIWWKQHIQVIKIKSLGNVILATLSHIHIHSLHEICTIPQNTSSDSLHLCPLNSRFSGSVYFDSPFSPLSLTLHKFKWHYSRIKDFLLSQQVRVLYL